MNRPVSAAAQLKLAFPRVTGANLLRQKVTVPDDLAGELRLVFIAFQQWQQDWVDTWVPLARRLEQSHPALKFYEFPVIQKMSGLGQFFINEGMRAGIPNPTTRQKTITLYLDKSSFRRKLEIPSEDTIWVLLLDRQGQVLWRCEGAFSPEKEAGLVQSIQAQAASSDIRAGLR